MKKFTLKKFNAVANKLLQVILLFSFVLLFNCEQSKIEKQSDIINILSNTDSNFDVTSPMSLINSGNYHFRFSSASRDSKITSVLKIYDSSQDVKVDIKQVIDESMPAYKLAIHKNIVIEASTIQKNLNPKEWNLIVHDFEKFIKSILFDDRINHTSSMVQSIFFHNSILNTKKRSLEANNDCKCTPHPGYFVGKNPFLCQEDFMIDTNLFIKVIESSGYSMSYNETEFYEYLKQVNKNTQFVTSDILFEIIEPQKSFLDKIETKYLLANNLIDINTQRTQDWCSGQGSDYGCCGNYDGCCYYGNLFCLYHDAACWNCGPWWCLRGCVVS